MSTLLKQSRLWWLGHILHIDNARIPKTMLYSKLCMGIQSVGHPKLCSKDKVKQGMDIQDWSDLVAHVGKKPWPSISSQARSGLERELLSRDQGGKHIPTPILSLSMFVTSAGETAYAASGSWTIDDAAPANQHNKNSFLIVTEGGLPLPSNSNSRPIVWCDFWVFMMACLPLTNIVDYLIIVLLDAMQIVNFGYCLANCS